MSMLSPEELSRLSSAESLFPSPIPVQSVSSAIWMGKPWASAAKEVLDAFIYGLVTALIFGWLWPR